MEMRCAFITMPGERLLGAEDGLKLGAGDF